MPRVSKKSAPPASEVDVSAAPAAPAAAAAAPVKKNSRKGKSKATSAAKQKPTPAPEPTPTPAPAAEPVPSATEPTSEQDPVAALEEQFTAMSTRLTELRALESSIVQDMRKLQKTTMKVLKDLSKRGRKRRVANPNVKRDPSGFAKPALISNELCSFLNVPQGTEMARTEVTKFLTSYIKEHDLQDPENRRRILPDKKLQSLLNPGKGDEVTFFNLQRYMKVHFPPSKASAVKV